MSTEKTESKQDVFNEMVRAMADPTDMHVIGDFVKVGKRWDMTHKDLVDKLVIIHRLTEIETRFGKAYLVDLDVEGEQKTALFGGQVLIEQLGQLADNLPVLAVIVKPARSYVLTNPTAEQIATYKQDYLT